MGTGKPSGGNPMAYGVGLGLVFGAAFGLIVHNLAMGMALGLVFGAAVGAAKKKRGD